MNEQYIALRDAFEQLQTLLDCRLELCQEWGQFSAIHKDASARAKALQQRMESRDLTQEDIHQINDELADIQVALLDWEGRKEQLESLMNAGQVCVKDRSSQRTLHFNTEIGNVSAAFVRMSSMLEKKQGRLDEVAQLWQKFEEQKQELLTLLNRIKDQVQQIKVRQPTLEGTRQYQGQMKELEGEVQGQATKFEEFRDLGRQLSVLDPSKTGRVQKGWLNAVGVSEFSFC